MSLPTKPGNAERGWNDPPVILHVPTNAGAESASPVKRTLLNKRVAYPVTNEIVGSNANNAQCSNQGVAAHAAPPIGQIAPSTGLVLLPPTMSTNLPRFTAPIIIPTMNPSESTHPASGTPTATNPITNTRINIADDCNDDLGIPNFDDDTQMFHYTLSKLQKTLLDVQHRLQPKTVDIIKKKLEVLSSMWENGSISYEVKSSMARLTTALHKRKCDVAHDMHMSLMMDYVSEVGQWMVGVKRLIQEARDVEAPLSPTDMTIVKTSNSVPLTVPCQPVADEQCDSAPQAAVETQSRDVTELPEQHVNSGDAAASVTQCVEAVEAVETESGMEVTGLDSADTDSATATPSSQAT